MLLEKQVSVTRFSIFYCDCGMIFREDVRDGFGPLDDDDVGGVGEGFSEVVGHETWVGKAVEIIMNETSFASRQGVRFGNSEARASDWFFDA